MRHDEWVAADERRHSPEVDYGTTWTDPARPGVHHRVAWNSGSGDLYLATHPAGDDLKVLLVNVDRSTVDGILHGWADQAVHGTVAVGASPNPARPSQRHRRRPTTRRHAAPIEPVAGEVRRDTIDEQPTTDGHLAHDRRPDTPAISDRAADELVGRHVTVSAVGQTGRTTITSWVSDVDVDGDIELDAMPGHSFPLSTVTFLDDGEQLPAVRRPDGERRPMRRDAWRAEDPRRHAPEQVYGRFWTFDDPTDFYSIVWNSGTGELYTYCAADTTVVVRAICDRRDTVEAVLADWPRRQIEACSGYDAVSAILAASGPADLSSPPAGGEPVYGVVVCADGTTRPFDHPPTYRRHPDRARRRRPHHPRRADAAPAPSDRHVRPDRVRRPQRPPRPQTGQRRRHHCLWRPLADPRRRRDHRR